MATGGASNLFECAVCLNMMLDRTPRSLSCLHTFCEECLMPLIKNKQIVCPTCRRSTDVQDGDVKQLPVNFFLHQMKDLALPIGNDSKFDTVKTELLCEICKNTTPSYNCLDCLKKLCNDCKRKHSSIRQYKKHTVFELCQDHHEIAEKVCKKCLIPLCSFCLSNHTKDHDMDEYDTAIEVLEKDIVAMKQSMVSGETKYDDNFEKIVVKHESHKEVLKELNERKRYYAEKVIEANKLIKETEDNIDKFKQLEMEYMGNRFECEDLKLDIEKLDSDSVKFQKVHSMKTKVEMQVENFKKIEKYEFPSFILCKHHPTKLAIPRPPDKIQNLEKVKLPVNLPDICETDSYNKQMAFIGQDILAITNKETSHVIRISQQGEILAHYYPKEEGDVVGVNFHNDKIYIVQQQAINVMTEGQDNQIKVYKPDIENMQKVFIIDNQNFLVSEGEDPGNVYLYNTVRNSKVDVITGLKCPTFINVAITEEGPRYVITERFAHCVRVYSETWTLLYTLGSAGDMSSADGMLWIPSSTAVTKHNTILVADSANDRICHFTLEGTFLSHVITTQDMHPVGLLYNNNLLWVSMYNGDLKCFQLEYQQ